MSNKQSIQSIIFNNLKLLYDKASTSSLEGKDNQQALSYYTQALRQIESIDATSQDIDELQYNIFCNIYQIYERQYNLTLAKEFLDKALQVADKLRQQDKIAKCLDRRGCIKRVEGNYDGALLDHNKSVEINLNIDKSEGLDIAYCYNHIGNVYYNQGKYDDAVSMYEKSLNIGLSALGDNHPSLAIMYKSIGNICDEQGKYDDAVFMYEKSLKIELSTLSDDHSGIAGTYNNIGLIYDRQGKYDDAVCMYQKSLKIRLSVLGDNHPSIADTYNNMGSVYGYQGKHDDAISMFEKSLKIKLSVLSDNHLSIADTYINMGLHYNYQGKCNDALSMHKKSLKIQLSALGDNHPSIADTYNNMGAIYRKQGRYDDAVAMYEKSLEINLSALGNNHSSVADTYTNIGLVYYDQGKDDDAISMCEKSLEIGLSALGDDHPNIAQLYCNMAMVYLRQGKYDNAISMLQKSLKIRLLALGDNHPNIAQIYCDMAIVYLRQGKYDNAISVLHKSLKINLTVLGDNHPSIADIYNSMACIYHEQCKFDDSISMHEKSLKIKLSAFGENHSSVADTYNNMGNVYNVQVKYDDAVCMYAKSLKIKLSVLGDNHPSIADTYINMGSVYNHQGKCDDALSMYKKSLKIQLSVLDDNHPSIASTYNNMGCVYSNQGKYDDAVTMYEKSLKINLSAFGDNHPEIAKAYYNMAIIYNNQGKYDDAVSMYEKSLKIDLSALGVNHLSIAHTYSNIGSVYQCRDNYLDALSFYEKAVSIFVNAHLQDHPDLALLYDNIANCYDGQNRHDIATEMRQKSNNIRHRLKQIETSNQTSTTVIDQSQDQAPTQDNVTPQLLSQQMQSQTASNSYDNDDRHHIQQSHDQALKEKQYFTAYIKALTYGSCSNKVIRAMYAGPQYVGKSSIMRVFTLQQLVNLQDPTQIADQSDKMVHLKVFKIKDRTTSNLQLIWENNIHQIVQLQYENINNQHISKLIYEQTKIQPLLVNDQHQTAAVQSPITNEYTILPSSRTDASTISSTDNNMFIQQCRDFFQYYYPSWLNKTADDSQYAKIWDFGGHSIYHVTHQPFLSGNSIYILVFNINQDIDDKMITRDGQLLNTTYLQSMREWLTSIIGGNANHDKVIATIDNEEVEYALPIVILVASHGDYITNKQEQIHRFKAFEQQLVNAMPRYSSNIYSSYVVFNCNPCDNSSNTLIERERCSLRLHEIMKSFVQSLPFMCNPIPIRWYIMATILQTSTHSTYDEVVSSIFNRIRANRVRKIMTIQEIESIAKDFGLYESDDELIAMLSYLHDLGEIIFCPAADGIIVTDVDWLLHIFRAIIQLHDCTSGSADIQSLYRKAGETGKISTKYINHVLLPNKLDNNTKNSILSLMETYNILCKIKSDNDKEDCQYFVPYLLRPDVKSFDLSEYHVSETLYIGYEYDDIPYIPDGIYYCLLSCCLKEWNNTKVQLNYQSAKFYLTSSRHYMVIKKEDSHIALQYCYQKLDDPTCANKIKSLVQTSIYKNCPHDVVKEKCSSLINDRMPKFKGAVIRYYVRCNKCSKLTFIENKDASLDGNLVQCQNGNCNNIFKSQSVKDWIYPCADKGQGNELKQKLTQPDRKHCKQQKSNMNPDNDDPSDYFYTVADMISIDWSRLAAFFGFSEDIDRIDHENHLIFRKAIKVLTKWKEKLGEEATIGRLIQALQQLERRDIIVKIKNERKNKGVNLI